MSTWIIFFCMNCWASAFLLCFCCVLMILCLQFLRFTRRRRFFARDNNLMSPLDPKTKSISTTSASKVGEPSFESILIASSSTLLLLLLLMLLEEVEKLGMWSWCSVKGSTRPFSELKNIIVRLLCVSSWSIYNSQFALV